MAHQTLQINNSDRNKPSGEARVSQRQRCAAAAGSCAGCGSAGGTERQSTPAPAWLCSALGGGKSCRTKEEEAKLWGKKKRARLQRARGKRPLCGGDCSEPGAAVPCGHRSSRGLLEHAVSRGPRRTSDSTETQGHGGAAAACPDSFQQDGPEISEDEGS